MRFRLSEIPSREALHFLPISYIPVLFAPPPPYVVRHPTPLFRTFTPFISYLLLSYSPGFLPMAFAISLLGHILLYLALGLGGSVAKAANLTVPNCNPQYNYGWSYNSLGQSPCYVAAAIRAPCHGGSFAIPPKIGGQSYDGPSGGDFEDFCSCSVVANTLMSACAMCQGGRITPWGSWTQYCEDPVPGYLENLVPKDTKIPHWAFQTHIIDTGIWDPQEAQQAGDMPETPADTQNTTSTTSGAPPSTTSSGSTLAPTPTQADSGSSGNSTRAGLPISAIVGASVGGALGLSLIAAGAIFWLRRHRRNLARPRADIVSYMEQSATESAVVTPFMSMYSESVPTKYYDPSDPSTFPVAPSASGSNSDPVHSEYNGLPEL
ncbi:hypothetical protein OF83DRAFT_280861 [Amylostereum chailletii]|nr:hypothetical protein OF83DRAFT_280861 [Amylostereum chailletii]